MERELRNWRRIPEPIQSFKVTLEISPPLRISRAADYVKTNGRWLFELQFNGDVELALFERFIGNTKHLRLAEYRSDVRRPSRFFLIDERVAAGGTMRDAEKWVTDEFPKVNAAVAISFPSFAPPTCCAMVHLREAGGIDVIPTRPANTCVVGMSELQEVRKLLCDTEDRVSPFVDKSAADQDFHEALRCCGDALGFRSGNPWASLYRAFEIVDDRFRAGQGIVNTLGCCSLNEIERFKRTTNHQEAIGKFSRHARLRYTPPPDPMPFSDALRLILRLLSAWCTHETGLEPEANC